MQCKQRKEQLIRNSVFAFLIITAAPGMMAESKPQLNGIARDAAEELWRRGTCVLSSIVEPAKRAAQVPPGLTGVEVAWGRPLSMTNRVTCFSKGKGCIWAATDSALFAIDTVGKKLAKQYTAAHGLPDEPTDALHADERILWIVQRGGLAALDLHSEKFLSKGMPRFSHAKIAADGDRAWVIADTGTYLYSHAAGSWETAPAIPTGEEIGRFLARGVWEGRRQEALRGLLGDPILFDGEVYIPSRGALYRFHQSSRSWSKVTDDAWKAVKSEGRVFFIGASGVGEYNPATGETVHYTVGKDMPNGRPMFLRVTAGAVWVALEAQPESESHRAGDGGVARFDLKTRKWVSYKEINGQKADQVTALQVFGGDVWCASQNYTEVAEIVAHPGMAHVKRTRPKVEGLSLHKYVAREDKWYTITLPIPEGERRMILGQRGTYNEDNMVPRRLLALAPGPQTIFCHFDMYPHEYYSGYYPTIGVFAKRDDPSGAWVPSFANHADQLHLQGEHPSVLLISGSHGQRIVLAEGHNEVLGLFRDETGTVWAVTEGCVAWFDETGKKWHRVVEPQYRFYWRATAAAADDESIYIGSDCGFITKIDRRTYESEVLVCLPKRKVAQLAFDDEGVLWVRTEDSSCRKLPVQLEDIQRGPDTKVVARQGKEWVAADQWPPELKSPENRWTFEGKANFVLRRTPSGPMGERVLFLAGVFRPDVLLHDPIDQCLWVSTYCGLVKLPIPTEATSE